ncbi:hypothetical protein ACET3Z_015724 [Daucus carota]
MEGQRVSHLRLLILLFAMALTISVSCSADNRDFTSLTRRGDAAERKKSGYNNVVMNKKRNYNGGGGGGSGIGGGGGWGWGGGGGGWWGWGCRRQEKYNGRGSVKKGNFGSHNGKVHKNERGEYIMGEYAQCMGRGRCRWRRLDCPLHCGGACFYDCKHMCKAHCRR